MLDLINLVNAKFDFYVSDPQPEDSGTLQVKFGVQRILIVHKESGIRMISSVLDGFSESDLHMVVYSTCLEQHPELLN